MTYRVRDKTTANLSSFTDVFGIDCNIGLEDHFVVVLSSHSRKLGLTGET